MKQEIIALLDKSGSMGTTALTDAIGKVFAHVAERFAEDTARGFDNYSATVASLRAT